MCIHTCEKYHKHTGRAEKQGPVSVDLENSVPFDTAYIKQMQVLVKTIIEKHQVPCVNNQTQVISYLPNSVLAQSSSLSMLLKFRTPLTWRMTLST